MRLSALLSAAAAAAAAMAAAAPAAPIPATVTVDTTAHPAPFEHFWKKTFGSGHARL